MPDPVLIPRKERVHLMTAAIPRGVRLWTGNRAYWGQRITVSHPRKPYHFIIDADGYVIVSETILERMKQINMGPFIIDNMVAYPPTQVLAMPHIKDALAVVHAPSPKKPPPQGPDMTSLMKIASSLAPPGTSATIRRNE